MPCTTSKFTHTAATSIKVHYHHSWNGLMNIDEPNWSSTQNLYELSRILMNNSSWAFFNVYEQQMRQGILQCLWTMNETNVVHELFMNIHEPLADSIQYS